MTVTKYSWLPEMCLCVVVKATCRNARGFLQHCSEATPLPVLTILLHVLRYQEVQHKPMHVCLKTHLTFFPWASFPIYLHGTADLISGQGKVCMDLVRTIDKTSSYP